MQGQRLFVAVPVPNDVRSQLRRAVEPLRSELGDLQWVAPSNWHITLAFIGHATIGQQVRAQVALAAAARRSMPCHVGFADALGRFGDKVLWAGVLDDDVASRVGPLASGPAGPLAALAEAVRRDLAAASVSFDPQPFRAHVTLARARGKTRVPRSLPRLSRDAEVLGDTSVARPRAWMARRLALMSSTLGAGPVSYHTVASWPL